LAAAAWRFWVRTRADVRYREGLARDGPGDRDESQYGQAAGVGHAIPQLAVQIRGVEGAQSGKIEKVLMAKAFNIQLRDDVGHKQDGPVPPGVDSETWIGPAPWTPFGAH